MEWHYFTAGNTFGVALNDRLVVVCAAEAGVDVLGNCSTDIFADDFESGNTSMWSTTVPAP